MKVSIQVSGEEGLYTIPPPKRKKSKKNCEKVFSFLTPLFGECLGTIKTMFSDR